jgi:hypothetical protein
MSAEAAAAPPSTNVTATMAAASRERCDPCQERLRGAGAETGDETLTGEKQTLNRERAAASPVSSSGPAVPDKSASI